MSVPLNQLKVEIPLKKVETLNETIERLARKYHQSVKVAKAIIHCESKGKQSARNYQAVVGVDIGMWQLNSYYHSKSAARMGFDIYKSADNLEYGFVLLSEQGLLPWSASKYCWSALV